MAQPPGVFKGGPATVRICRPLPLPAGQTAPPRQAPDEASHQADWKTKIAAIEHIDKYVVGPVMQKMRTFPEWRLLVMPDHPTLISNRKHGYGPAPFVIAGTGVKQTRQGSYCEKNAASGVRIEQGENLMEYFLHGT